MKTTLKYSLSASPVTLGVSALIGGLLLTACSGDDNEGTAAPVIGARAKSVLTVDGSQFKDSNGDGKLDAYEDWRLPAGQRADDLVSKMTLDEKAGMMLIDTLNAGLQGVVAAPAADYINNQKMTRFILRNTVIGTPDGLPGVGLGGAQVTPGETAQFTNAIQQMAEATRLGIPVVFKSNARNHYERSARAGINVAAGAFSEWPKEPGLAATRDMGLIADFAQTMGAEWKAIGLRGMYGYIADMSTEPRWYRIHETFSEDADLNANIVTALVTNLQGGPISPNTSVALTMKHFPGGGPQEGGLDPHYTFGKNQVYPAGNFGYHVKPFKAAIDAGVSAIMPYYGVPINVTFEGVTYDAVGMAFSKQIVTDLLRGKLGFGGYVNSDTGIINDRGWGLESKTVPERVATAINGGTDVLSGFHDKQTIVNLVNLKLLSEGRVNEAVKRLLTEQFKLGLFENPYVDASKADNIVGNDTFRARALNAQRKSVVLLQNQDKTLPLPAPTAAKPVKLYTLGLNKTIVTDAAYGGYTVVTGDYDATKGETLPAVPTDTDYAVIRVEVTNVGTSAYKSNDPATGGRINPATGRAWGADDPAGIDNGLPFGGAFPWEVNALSFTEMAKAQSWKISPSLADIQAVMTKVGAKKTILSIYFRQPYVLDQASGLRNAGAILAGFGVSDSTVMDVVTGKFNPQGKLPFALANNLGAVIGNEPDAPGYPAADTLYPFGFGLSY